MAWYYFGMAFNRVAADKGAKKLRDKYNVKTKITKSKDVLGGYLYKIFTSKSIG